MIATVVVADSAGVVVVVAGRAMMGPGPDVQIDFLNTHLTATGSFLPCRVRHVIGKLSKPGVRPPKPKRFASGSL